jgi:hypothetical protein
VEKLWQLYIEARKTGWCRILYTASQVEIWLRRHRPVIWMGKGLQSRDSTNAVHPIICMCILIYRYSCINIDIFIYCTHVYIYIYKEHNILYVYMYYCIRYHVLSRCARFSTPYVGEKQHSYGSDGPFIDDQSTGQPNCQTGNQISWFVWPPFKYQLPSGKA